MQVAPNLSFLCISESVGEGKVTVFAHCTDTAQKSGLHANAWVNRALKSVGGKGGGKPGAAQGSISVDDKNRIDEVTREVMCASKEVIGN